MASHDSHHTTHHHEFSDAFAEHLDRESHLFQAVTEHTIDRAALALNEPIQTVLDLGSGTGAAAIALARKFPEAQVHCVDVSSELLERITKTAEVSDVADQIHTHPANLDEDWTHVARAGVDLVWASLSLHHLADAGLALRRALSVLRPGGMLVITETAGSVVLAPDNLGTAQVGLAGRVADGLVARGYPPTLEWAALLADAGFIDAQREVTELSVSAKDPVGKAYLAAQMSVWLNHLAQELSTDDLAALKSAERELDAGASPVRLSAGREVWVAVRPENEDNVATTVAGEA